MKVFDSEQFQTIYNIKFVYYLLGAISGMHIMYVYIVDILFVC